MKAVLEMGAKKLYLTPILEKGRESTDLLMCKPMDA